MTRLKSSGSRCAGRGNGHAAPSEGNATVVYTIGYEGRGIRDFIEQLKAKDVEVLLDVRDNPNSRNRDFCKSRLERTLGRQGIRYEHKKGLGNPKPIRDAYKLTGNKERFVRAFSAFLSTRKDDLNDLHVDVITSVCCVMCVERDPETCHRSLVGERLRSLNGHAVAVVHIE
ncbi:MAG: DUF488 domain-containing protein [Candidatus Coatesbacteria bacterium]